MLLAIDTSSRYGGMALADTDGNVVAARLWHTRTNHTAQLMPAVASALQTHGLQVAHLTGVAVALGPGPFSALRVGVSAAKGLAMAAGLPIVGIDTLALEALPHVTPDGIVSAWLDAGRNEVAAAWFGGDCARQCDDAIAAPESLLRRESNLTPAPILYCGEAAHARRHDIRSPSAGHDTDRPAAVAPWTPADRLWALAGLASQRIRDGDTDDLSTLQPYYLRMPSIGAPKQRDRVAQGRPASA